MKEFVKKLIGRLEERIEIWRKDVTSGVKQDGGYLSLDTAKKSGRIKGLLDAIEIVNQLAEEYNNGWIPCEKKLPKENEFVISSIHPSKSVNGGNPRYNGLTGLSLK